MNGFSTGEEDSRGAADQICCLVDESERCSRPAGNASYSKRIQKTVTQRRLKLNLDHMVSITWQTRTSANCRERRFSLSETLGNIKETWNYNNDFSEIS